MNEKLEERLISYLDSIAKQANNAGDFFGEQLPLVAQEYIQFHFYSSIVSLVFFVLMFCFFCWTFFVLRSKFKKGVYEHECAFGQMLSIFFNVLLTIGIFCALTDIVKNVTAPRIVVLEKVADLVKEKV